MGFEMLQSVKDGVSLLSDCGPVSLSRVQSLPHETHYVLSVTNTLVKHCSDTIIRKEEFQLKKKKTSWNKLQQKHATKN